MGIENGYLRPHCDIPGIRAHSEENVECLYYFTAKFRVQPHACGKNAIRVGQSCSSKTARRAADRASQVIVHQLARFGIARGIRHGPAQRLVGEGFVFRRSLRIALSVSPPSLAVSCASLLTGQLRRLRSVQVSAIAVISGF
jgi:hypothetical protein